MGPEVPRPPGHPVLGHTIPYLRDPFGFLTESAEYGRVVRLEFPGRTVYQLTSPEDVERVLVHENQRYEKGELIREVLGSINERGLLVTEGDVWRRQRTLVSPAFHPGHLAEYATTMTGTTERTVDRWQGGETRDVHDDMMELTLEIVAAVLFGVDIRQQVVDIGESLEVIMGRSENAFVDVVPRWAPTPGNRRFHRAVDRVRGVVSEIVDRRRRDPGSDVVSALLAAGEDGEHGDLSDDEIADQVMTLLLAGHETTALALTFALYLLARHPEVERRLLEELEGVLDGQPPTAEDLPALAYTERVVTEAMRLYPPVHTIVRESVEPVEIAGHSFPAETTVAMHQWTVHRDPEHYPDPLSFEPERWTDAFEATLPRFAYFPFGGGPRRCVGDRFAMMEATLVLATVLRRVHLELVSPPSLRFAWTITTRPKEPIEMTVHERASSFDSAVEPDSGLEDPGGR